MPTSDSTYIGARVPREVAEAFKRRARDLDRSATAQLRQLIREFGLGGSAAATEASAAPQRQR